MQNFLKKLSTLLLIISSIPVILLVRFLRPFITIRFGPLVSDRIGQFAFDPEFYLCERDAGKHKKTFDVFYHINPIGNKQLKKMWDRTLWIFTFAKILDRTNNLLPGGEKHQVSIYKKAHRDFDSLLLTSPPHLYFTPEEEYHGQSQLRKLGISEGASFICFHSRDPMYLKTVLQGKDWSYHNYRDSNIHNYIPAAEVLSQKNYFLIRMGHIVKEPLNIKNDRIIDYATNGHRTDFLDIYLSAKCQFFISSAVGICSLPLLFRRPIAFVNFIPIENALICWNRNYLLIPKKLWLRKEHRFLTFREIINSDIWAFIRMEHYEQLGIEAIENTPEEITALAIEMEQRLKGKWITTQADEELQQRFWSLLSSRKLPKKNALRIGTEFLRGNQNLLA